MTLKNEGFETIRHYRRWVLAAFRQVTVPMVNVLFISRATAKSSSQALVCDIGVAGMFMGDLSDETVYGRKDTERKGNFPTS